jgi:hypothetical protein
MSTVDVDDLRFESDGTTVRVTVRNAERAYLVVGSTPGGGSSPDGDLQIEKGSITFPAGAEITFYEIRPLTRWPPVGLNPDIRCMPDFSDCPLPPPPIPIWQSVRAVVKGAP